MKKVESSLLCVELQWRRVQSCYLRLFFGVSIFVCVCFAGIVSEVMAATMATMAVTTPVVAGLGGSSLRRRAASPSKVQLTSGLKFSPCLSLLSCITICKGFVSIILCSARLTELSCVIYVYSVRERRQKLLFDDPESAAGAPPLHVTRHLVCTSFSSSL